MLHYNSIPFQRSKHNFLAKHLFVATCGFLFAHNNVVECFQIPCGCGQMLVQMKYIYIYIYIILKQDHDSPFKLLKLLSIQ